ncbi:uracil-DNA glycosylase [Furfurilactobacillus siliginis]|uniref:Uracil-DNA glycosylase n=1 Tax=Furfurilactobacillus siliginis TaxID=348151 RepID=A0A0R2L5V2_9LACO|nr:uracil-DNA glycosylase [Furfurilactobacillus siliginis]KRN97176.1 uracil-DNA glycosylase family protein [Furfurilactobacillus siliginis]GEK28637.1 uracil-DNA glycosylase [Furfurilactobacillus siliginis]
MATFLTDLMIEQAKQLINENPKLEGFVPGEGSLTPKFVLVSEAPGAKEAELSYGFQGPAGRELNRWLELLGVTRDEIYMTGAVRARPFDETNGRKRDRKPSRAEIADFAPLLDFELSQLPDNTLLVPLGNTGLQRLLGNRLTITKIHGDLIKSPVLEYHLATKKYLPSKRVYPILPLFHPSYSRRFPSKRPLIDADLAVLKELL